MSCQEQNLEKKKRSASLCERRGIQPLLLSNPVKDQKPIRDAKETKTNDTKTIAEQRSEVIREKARIFSSQKQKAQQSLNLLNYEGLANTGSREDKLLLSKLAMKNLQALQRHGNNLLGAIQVARKAEAENFFKERKYKWRELLLFLERYATTLPLFLGAIHDPRASQLVGEFPLFETELIPTNSLKILTSDLYLIDYIGESDKDKAQCEISRSKLIPLPRYRAHPKYHRDAFFPKDAIVLAKWPTSTVFYKAFVVSTPSDQEETYRVNFDFELEEEFVDEFTSPEVPQMFVINYVEMAKDDKPNSAVPNIGANEHSEPQSAVGDEAETTSNAKNDDLELEEKIGCISELSIVTVKCRTENHQDNDFCHVNQESAAGGEAKKSSKNDASVMQIGATSELPIATAKSRTEIHHDNDFSDVNDEDGRDTVLLMTSDHTKAYHEDFDSDIEDDFVDDFYSPEASQTFVTNYVQSAEENEQESAAGGGAEKISEAKNDDSVLQEQIGGISELSIANAKGGIETHQHEICGVGDEYPTEPNYEQIENAKDRKCESGNKVFAGRNSGNGRVSKHKNGQHHKCDQCSFSSIKSSLLVTHMRFHASTNIHKCGQCPYITNNTAHLKRHIRRHAGQKPFKCNKCPYSNNIRSQFVIHMRSHAGIKIYECDQCSYITNNTEHLQRHIRAHTGEKPYKCEQCSYASARNDNLKRHIRDHHA
ncbi:c2H2-type zinc-finger domain-containing protein [Ditylenchus destructor]|uniref:C2H2-type zinc-finger domain-containing protein n=1 Tax=Ditylenchus destructor TaxID=166010 RepID=A0AAD4MHT7_9BILA|nr:c2H2-type zinc-finger domain-containing protein [Ditylenchus destructor]